jgi:hypothetical protein
MIEVPAQTPTSLSVVVASVFVTPEPARTEKFAAVPRLITVGPAAFEALPTMPPIAMTNAMATIATIAFEFFMLVAPLRAPMRGVSVCFGWSTDWPSVS